LFGCGGHLDRRAEPPENFLEENHPMTISSKFCSYWANGFRQEDFYVNFPLGPMLSFVRLWGPSWSKGRTAGKFFGREPSNDYFIKILFLLSKWFQARRFLWEFPIGSYVKLSSAVAAILVGFLKCRTHFWKRNTQESFQQSLVEIGSVFSEKIFFNFLPPFFLICIFGQNRQKLKVNKKSRNIC
jgi:hypothetical protein